MSNAQKSATDSFFIALTLRWQRFRSQMTQTRSTQRHRCVKENLSADE
jgi:hypothetical protein